MLTSPKHPTPDPTQPLDRVIPSTFALGSNGRRFGSFPPFPFPYAHDLVIPVFSSFHALHPVSLEFRHVRYTEDVFGNVIESLEKVGSPGKLHVAGRGVFFLSETFE
jgi:hypothetical protein